MSNLESRINELNKAIYSLSDEFDDIRQDVLDKFKSQQQDLDAMEDELDDVTQKLQDSDKLAQELAQDLEDAEIALDFTEVELAYYKARLFELEEHVARLPQVDPSAY